MSAVAQLFRTFLGLFGVQLQPWMGGVMLALMLFVILPLQKVSKDTQKARKLVTTSTMLGLNDREKAWEEAFSLVKERPSGLVAVAEAAVEAGHPALFERALGRLEKVSPKDAAVLRKKTDTLASSTPHAEALAVERLLEQGRAADARARWERAAARWPSNPDLVELKGRFEA